MKKIWLMVYIVFITACSPNHEKVQFDINTEALASFIDVSTETGDYQTVSTSTTKIFIFKNLGDTPGPAAPALSNTNFSIILQTGCATVNVGSTCTVRVNFNPSGKSPNTYSTDLNVGGTLKTLTATVGVPINGGTGPIEATISDVVITNPLDFGQFTGTQSSTKTIKLTNKSSSSMGPISAMLSNTDFTFLINSCVSKTLAPNAFCSVRVSFNATGKSAQDYLSDLTFGSSTFPLKATVSNSGTTTGGGSSNLTILEGLAPITTPVDYGTLTGSQSLIKIFTIKNTGSSNIIVNPTLNNTNFTMILNSCSNKNLLPNGSCSIRVGFAAKNKTDQEYLSTITVVTGSTIELKATVSGSQGGGIIYTYDPVFSNWGTCSADLACEGVGSQMRTITQCNRFQDGNPAGVGTLADCASFNIPLNTTQSCNSPQGEIDIAIPNGTQHVSCEQGSSIYQVLFTNCDLNYHVENNLCVQNIETYYAQYSDYVPLQEDIQVCQGQVLATRAFTCHKISDNSLVDDSFCPIDTNPTITRESPAGQTGSISIAHGQKILGCEQGSNESTIISLTCDIGYFRGGERCYQSPQVLATDLEPISQAGTLYKFMVPTGNYFYYGKLTPTLPKKIVVSDGINILGENPVCNGTGQPQYIGMWGVDDTGKFAQTVNCSSSRKRALYLHNGTNTISTPEISGTYNIMKTPLLQGFLLGLWDNLFSSITHYSDGVSLSSPNTFLSTQFNSTNNTAQVVASLPNGYYIFLSHSTTLGAEPYKYNPLLPITASNPILLKDTTPGSGGIINVSALIHEYRGFRKKSDDNTIVAFSGLNESTLATFLLVYDDTQALSEDNPKKINCTGLASNNQNYGGCTPHKIVNNKYLLFTDTAGLYLYDVKTRLAPVLVGAGISPTAYLGNYNNFEFFYINNTIYKINLITAQLTTVLTLPEGSLSGGENQTKTRPTYNNKAYFLWHKTIGGNFERNLSYFDLTTEEVTQITSGKRLGQFYLHYDQGGVPIMFMSFSDPSGASIFGIMISDGTQDGTVPILSGPTMYIESPSMVIQKTDGWDFDVDNKNLPIFKLNNRVIIGIGSNIYSIDTNPN